MSVTAKFVTEYASVVDAPAANVWGILAAWGSEKLWMPNCTASALEGFGLGSVRDLDFTTRPGITTRETLEAINATDYTQRFRVEISAHKDALHYGNVRLEPVNDTQTRVIWSGESSLDDEGMKESLDQLYEGFNNALSEVLKA